MFQCAQWSNYSCCTQNSSLMAHEKLNHYGFDIEHCGKESLSSKCHRRFVQDLCYYDCDPYIGPWIVRQNWSRRQERIMYVPLCKSECDQWWEDCKDSSTCVTNWAKHFVWVNESGRRTNKCPSESECKPFKALFNSATEFCEKVILVCIYKNVFVKLIVNPTDLGQLVEGEQRRRPLHPTQL